MVGSLCRLVAERDKQVTLMTNNEQNRLGLDRPSRWEREEGPSRPCLDDVPALTTRKAGAQRSLDVLVSVAR